MDDGLDPAVAGCFVEREVIIVLGNLTNEAQLIVGKQTAIEEQLIGFEFAGEQAL